MSTNQLEVLPVALTKRKDSTQKKPAARLAAEDRRKQIIEVATRLFSQKGFSGTTTKEIALAAGVNEAIIFRHFSTKSELYTAIIHEAEVNPLWNALAEASELGDDRQVFESLAFDVLEFHDHNDAAMRLMLYSALEGHELAETITRNYISNMHRQVATYIKNRMADGVFRPMDPMVAVRAFMGMVIAHVLSRKFFMRSEEPAMTNRQAAAAFADIFLASMTNLDYDDTEERRKSQ